VAHVGIDEKSFGSGHDYISVMTDIPQSRVLEVAPERTIDACDKLFKSLSEGQLATIQSVSMDMWQAFMSSTSKNVPNADIVHDRFHVSKYLNEAVDKVRRSENRELKQQGDDSLTGMRQLFLYNLENLSSDAYVNLSKLQKADLKTGEAWSMKENFRNFWTLKDRTAGQQHFANWHWWASGSGLSPIEKVAGMLKRHLEGLLNYFDHRVTNATSEGFNSKIQSIKSAARGFRNFENYRIRILFYCGKLNLQPNITH
jgi:transposase